MSSNKKLIEFLDDELAEKIYWLCVRFPSYEPLKKLTIEIRKLLKVKP